MKLSLSLLGKVGSAFAVAMLLGLPSRGAEAPTLKVLMLGDKGHHRPADLHKVLAPVLTKSGIRLDFTIEVGDLVPAKLAKYDALLIFRDTGSLPARNESALLEFVEGGKGLFALHCASHCFRNSDRYTALVGGRFWKHGLRSFRPRIVDAQHPAMKGVRSFETVDETYVHNQVAEDIRVLMVRDEDGSAEPYTWVRRQGKGRVFYTALGHDERTWKRAGFQRLVEQGLRWSAGKVPDRKDVGPFKYVKADVPNYLPGKSWGALGEPIRRMQLPLSPEESMKHLHLPEGFEAQLYAAEPDIARPLAMAWDARGRLWIAESVDYPNDMQPPGKGRDRIKICEDIKGTGRADKFTVFADKLSIPTSLTFANGGAIVAQAPNTLFLKDSKGGDKADVREVLFRGWGTYDTHAGPSNLRPGLDNWVWGTVGYAGFKGKVGGRSQQFRQGIFRFKPDGSQMEFLASTSNNTWGLGLGEKGEVFASTANGQHSVHLALPNRVFEGVRGWSGQGAVGIADHKKIHPITSHVRQVDHHGGFTAAAGHALYTARSFPEEYWNKAAFVCEPTGHLIHVNRLAKKGSGYVARDGWNILASDDEWTAPIAAEVGPDGALWVIDWYNFIVQHNPTPAGFKTGKGGAYVTPLRDKTRGRIYRIVYTGKKGGTKAVAPALDRAAPKALVATLNHDSLWWRQTAQRLLVERGKDDVLPALAEQVRAAKGGPAATHALWTMHGLGAFKASDAKWLDAAAAGLKHPDAGARRAALAVLPRTAASVAAILAAKSLADEDAEVRLAALLALGEMPGSKAAAAAVVAVLSDPVNAKDQWIPKAAVSAAAKSDLAFLQAAAEAKPKTETALIDAVRAVAGHLARRAPTEATGDVLTSLGKAQPKVAEALLTGLVEGWPAGKHATLDARADAALQALPGKLSPGGLLQLAALVQRWGQQAKLAGITAGVKKSLLARVGDAKLGDEARLAAARDLIVLGADGPTATALLEQMTPRASPALTKGLLDVLSQASAEEVGTALVKRWAELAPSARPVALVALLRRPAWTRALLAGLEKGEIDKADLSLDHVQQLTRHPNDGIATLAKKVLASGGRLPSPDRQKVLDKLMPLAKKRGDPAVGKLVFEKNCAKCHRFGDVGQTVGPDLTGIGARDRGDVLIDVLDPNRSVEGNYRQYTIETKRGLLLTGLLVNETKTSVELLDAEAKKHVVLRENIESLSSNKMSLMPEGFEKLGESELTSLLEYLAARGKYFPLSLAKAATITSVRGMFNSRDSDVERLVFPKWGPQTAFGVPFQVIDPRGGSIPNVVLLYSKSGPLAREMPKSVSVPCNSPAKAIHVLGGVAGWAHPFGKKGSVSMIVRLHYADGKTEDHELLNGVHVADYIRVVDVPESKLAFRVRGQQVRYLSVVPKRTVKIDKIDFVKGADGTAPVVVAVTVEGPG